MTQKLLLLQTSLIKKEDIDNVARILEILKDQPLTEVINFLDTMAKCSNEDPQSITVDVDALYLCHDLLAAASKILGTDDFGHDCGQAAIVLKYLTTMTKPCEQCDPKLLQ